MKATETMKTIDPGTFWAILVFALILVAAILMV